MEPIKRGPLTYNPDISGQFVHPSSLPYAAGGQSPLARMEFMPRAVQIAAQKGSALDAFWGRSDVGQIIRTSPVVQQTLARYGFTSLTLQENLTGQPGQIPMRGTTDLNFRSGGQIKYITDDKVTNRPIMIVDDMLVAGETPYGFQVQAYAALSGASRVGATIVPRPTALAIEDQFETLPDQEREQFIAKLIEAHIVGGDRIDTTSGNAQLTAALETLREVRTETQPANPALFQPGGQGYELGIFVAKQQAAAQEITGVAFEKLRYQELPAQFSAQYDAMYTALGNLAQKVARGEIGLGFAKSEAERVRYAFGLPWDAKMLQSQTEIYPVFGIGVSPTFGTTSTYWGTAIGPEDPRYAILGAPIRISGGTFTTPMTGTTPITGYASEAGRTPSALTGQYGELVGRPIINGRLAIRYQNPEGMLNTDAEQITEQKLLAAAIQIFEDAGGGEAGTKRVQNFMQAAMAANPIIGKNIMTTSTSAARNLLRLAVNISDVVGMQIPDPTPEDRWHTRQMTHQDWFRMSSDLVYRGAEPSIAWPLTEVVRGIAGWTVTPTGMLRTGLAVTPTENEAEKLDKRMQQALRRDSLLTAPSRNIAGITRMEGTSSVEFGILIRNAAVSNLTAEGQNYFDAQTIREIGAFKIAHTLSYEIKPGDDFKPAEGKFQVVQDHSRPGEYRVIIGKNHGIDVAVPLKDFDSFYADSQGARIRQEGGRTFFEADGIGEVNPNSQTVKSWLAVKGQMAPYQELRRDINANYALKGNVEALLNLPKNTRQMAYITFAGEFGPLEGVSASENQRRLNKFVRELKALGIDPEQRGFLVKPNAEELQGFAARNISPPSHVVLWNYELDEAMLKIARKKYEQAVRRGQATTFTTPMSFEEAYMFQQAFGEEAVGVSDWSQWEADRERVRDVQLKMPTAIMPLMLQVTRDFTGRAAISLEEMAGQIGEAKRMHGDQRMQEVYNYIMNDFLPMAAKASGHTRDYYQGLLKSQLASQGITQPEAQNVAEWSAIQDLINQTGSIHLAMRVNSTLTNQMIRLPSGQFIPSLSDLRVMSVDSPLRKAMLTPEGYEEEETPFPVDEHNAIVRMLGEMASNNVGSGRFNYLSDRVSDLLEKLTSTKAVEKGLFQLNLTGGGGVESPYVAYTGLRPWEKVVGGRNLMKLFGTEDLDAISSMINGGQNMVFGQRRPNVLPFLSGLVPSILRKHTDFREYRKTKYRQIPEEFGGTAMSPTAMDVHIGDFDGDRMAIFLAATEEIAQTAANSGLSERSAEQLFLSRMKATLELVTGETIPGGLTWRNYVDRVVALKDASGNKLSEIANWIKDADRAAVTPDRLTQKFMAEMTVQQGRLGMLQKVLYKVGIGPVMNRFTRNMGAMMEQMGLSDEYRTVVGRFDQRLQLFSYQTAIDAPVSQGLRKLLAISKYYSVRQSAEGDQERLWGQVMDDLAPTMERQGFERIDFDQLPTEIIKAVLESTELRGIGDPEKAIINKRWAEDVGLLLSRDRNLAARIAEAISPLQGMKPEAISAVVESVADKIMKELIGNAKTFWETAGPLPAVMGGHITARARKAQRTQWFGRYSEEQEGKPISGISLIAELQEQMLASQRVPSGTSAEAEFEYRKKAGLMGLLHDIAYAQVPAVLAKALGIPGAITLEEIKRRVPRFQSGSAPDTRIGMLTEEELAQRQELNQIKAQYSVSEEEAMAIYLNKRQVAAEMSGLIQQAQTTEPQRPGNPLSREERLANAQARLARGGWGREDAVPVYFVGGRPKTTGTVFGKQFGDVLREAVGMEELPTRQWISQQRREGRITSAGVRSILTATRGEGGYSSAETVMDKLTSLKDFDLANQYARLAERGGVMTGTLGERFGTLYEAAGQQFGEEDLARALGDYSYGLLGDEGLRSIARRGGVKGVGAMAAEVKRLRGGGADRGLIMGAIQEMAAGSNVSDTHLAEQRMEKFSGNLEKVNLHLEHYDDLLRRTTDAHKYALETDAQQRTFDRGLLREMQGMAKAVMGGPGQEQALGMLAGQMGVAPGTVARYVGAVTGAPGEELAQTVAGPARGGGVMGTFRGLLQGDLGNLGWTLFNAQRAWNYTVGRVTGAMSDYAGFTAQQQQLGAVMGGPQGYTGPVSDILRAQAGMRNLELQFGRSAWNVLGPVVGALGGLGAGMTTSGGSIMEPLMNVGVEALIGGGVPIGLGVLGGAVGRFLPEARGVGAAMTGAATGMFKGFMRALPALGGLELGQWAAHSMFGVPSQYNLGSGLTDILGGAGAAIFAGPQVSMAQRTGRPEDYQAAAEAMAVWANGMRGVKQIFGDNTEAANQMTKQFEASDAAIRRLNPNLAVGEGTQYMAAVSRLTGLPGTQLMTQQAYQAAAMLSRMPEPVQQQVAQFAAMMGQVQGTYAGQAGMLGLLGQAGQLYQTDMQEFFRAQAGAEKISPFIGAARQAGVALPFTPEALAAIAQQPTTQWMLNQYAQGDPLTRSNVAAAMLRGDLSSTYNVQAAPRYASRIISATEARTLAGGQPQGAITVRNPATGQVETLSRLPDGNYVASAFIGMAQTAQVLSPEDLRQTIQVQPAGSMAPGLPIGTTADTLGLRSNLAMTTGMYQQGWAPGMYGLASLQQLPSIYDLQVRQNQLQNLNMIRSQYYAQQDLMMNGQQMFGGPSQFIPTGAGGLSGITMPEMKGSFYWAGAAAGESIRNIQAMARLQAGTLNYGWAGGAGPDWAGAAYTGGGMAGLGALVAPTGQLGGASLAQLGQAGLQYRQTLESLALQSKWSGVQRGFAAAEATAGYEKGMTQLQWSEQDLMTNFARQMKQFTYSLQDLNTNFARGQTQFGWQREDLRFQQNQQALQFGWGMQDVDEAMRFATGRERRQLTRQRERMGIQYGMGVEQAERAEGRLDTREKWAEEDFNKSRTRTEEQRKWAEDDFKKEKARIDTRRGWLDDDLNRALARIGAEEAMEKEQMALRIKQLGEDQKMAKSLHDEQVKHALASAGIAAAQAKEAEKWAKFEFDLKVARLGTSIKAEVDMANATGALALASTIANIQMGQIGVNLGPTGPIASGMKALSSMVEEGLVGDDPSSISNLFEKLIVRMKSELVRAIANPF